MNNHHQTREINRFLKKFDLEVKDESKCSRLVADWVRTMNDRHAFRVIQRKTKNYVDVMILGIDKALAQYASQPDDSHNAQVKKFENQKRLLVLAQKNLEEGDTAIREVYEMLLAGIQSVHASLKQDSLTNMPNMVQPVFDVWTEGTTPQETALLPQLKFLQKSRTSPDGKTEYFIIMHPNALVTWAARKEMNKSEAPDVVEKKTKDLMKYFMHAGGEEYYHVFQHSNPEKAKDLHRKSSDFYKTKDYEPVRLGIQAEMAELLKSNPEAFQRKNEQYHLSDPVESDAHTTMKRQDKLHDGMATAYYRNRQRGVV